MLIIREPYIRDGTGLFIEGRYTSPEIEYLANLDWKLTELVTGIPFRVELNDRSEVFFGKSAPKLVRNSVVNQFITSWSAVPYMGYTIYGVVPDKVYHTVSSIITYVYSGTEWVSDQEIEYVAGRFVAGVAHIVSYDSIAGAVMRLKKGRLSTYSNIKLRGFVASPKFELLDVYGNPIVVKIKNDDLDRFDHAFRPSYGGKSDEIPSW